MNGSSSAAQFNNVQVNSDPGARGMMMANDYREMPISLSANSAGSYNNDMALAFKNRTGVGQRVRPWSAKTNSSSTWTAQ
jgi:hypothetical protein